MAQLVSPRRRKVKILATLGPASKTPEMIRALYFAGADAFRINMSHTQRETLSEKVESVKSRL